MKSLNPAARLGIVLAFLAASAVFFWYLLDVAGAQVKGAFDDGYRITVPLADVGNLIHDSDVRIAGVRVGKVERVDLDGERARMTVDLTSSAAPLHEGVTVRVGEKTVLGEGFVDIVDGRGPALADGATLPESAVKPSVQLQDLMSSLDSETRASLGAMVRSAAAGTAGTRDEIADLLEGLGRLGREGHTALDAIAAQSKDLEALSAETVTLLAALDTGDGQIASLVSDAQRLTSATAGSKRAVQQTIRTLPTTMDRAQSASSGLTALAAALSPVASDLRLAAPGLNDALLRLPSVSRDLRGLLPALDATLDRSPATLDRVPTFGGDVRALVPDTRRILRDVNPMLAYLQPYGRDIAAYFANFAAVLTPMAEDGLHYANLQPVLNEQSLRGYPSSTNLGPLDKSNSYPSPGQSADPGPFTGTYPRVEREGR